MIQPGDTVIYLGGLVDADNVGFKVGDKYLVSWTDTGARYDEYLVVAHPETGSGIVIRDMHGDDIYNQSQYFKIDDGLGMSRIEPSAVCNCHAEHTPKGCSSWCNTQPIRKVS